MPAASPLSRSAVIYGVRGIAAIGRCGAFHHSAGGCTGRFEAAHLRHVEVHKRHIERVAAEAASSSSILNAGYRMLTLT